jgi:hypothetical protein
MIIPKNNKLNHTFIGNDDNNNNSNTIFLFRSHNHYELLTYSEKSFFNNAEREQIINNLAEIGKNLE